MIVNNSLNLANKILSIAQAGLTYSENKYDLDRYAELKSIAFEILARVSENNFETIENLYKHETGYYTPKVDVRAVVFRNKNILLVKEESDGKWSLPGGWADVGLTPSEVAVKECKEEAGVTVSPIKFLAFLDKKMHNHPPFPFYTYKAFILCNPLDDNLQNGLETSDVGYFDMKKLPPLSEGRNTIEQIQLMFQYLEHPDKETTFD
jgi:ADP-ribose pyrophosphatase YjhB (NUDIX family)